MNDIAYKFLVYAPYGNDDFLGELRNISSLQWLEDYQSAGEAKIVCGATSLNLSLMSEGNRIINTERPNCTAVVCEVDITDTANDAKMTVRARMSLAQWEDRVIMHTENISNAEESILRITANNRRSLPCNIGTAKGLTEKLDTQKSWSDVYSAICEIAQTSGLGIRVAANDNLVETLEVYKGIDRTIQSSKHYIGYFGDDIKNIHSVRLQRGDANYKNVAIVAGRGEGVARTVVKVDLSNGRPPRELFVDAKDVNDTYQVKNNGQTVDVPYTQIEYEALLRSRGIEKLAEHGLLFDIQPTVTEAVIIPGRDYDLGDILPLQLKKYGIQISVRVQQLKFIYEQKRTVEAVLKVVII